MRVASIDWDLLSIPLPESKPGIVCVRLVVFLVRGVAVGRRGRPLVRKRVNALQMLYVSNCVLDIHCFRFDAARTMYAAPGQEPTPEMTRSPERLCCRGLRARPFRLSRSRLRSVARTDCSAMKVSEDVGVVLLPSVVPAPACTQTMPSISLVTDARQCRGVNDGAQKGCRRG